LFSFVFAESNPRAPRVRSNRALTERQQRLEYGDVGNGQARVALQQRHPWVPSRSDPFLVFPGLSDVSSARLSNRGPDRLSRTGRGA
jgi:hypothetical protein